MRPGLKPARTFLIPTRKTPFINFFRKRAKIRGKKNFKEALDILETLSKKDPRDKKLKEEIVLRREKIEIWILEQKSNTPHKNKSLFYTSGLFY